ncbi:MAG: hypothetical protein WA949_14405 [Phormidesmis sp.]
MMANEILEERLAVVEAAIAQSQKQVLTAQPTDWLQQQITRSFKDEPLRRGSYL